MTDTTTTTRTTIDRFLDILAAGEGAAVVDVFADDAVLDATTPGWRFELQGREPIAEQFSRWFADAGRYDELDRRPFDGGEAITYLLCWEENGMPWAVHHGHVVLTDEAGRITRDTVFCGGRWNATRLAEMAAAHNG